MKLSDSACHQDKGMSAGYFPEEPDTFYEQNDDLRTWITEDTCVEALKARKTTPFRNARGGRPAVAVLIGIVFYFSSKTGDEKNTQPATAEKPEQEAELFLLHTKTGLNCFSPVFIYQKEARKRASFFSNCSYDYLLL